MTRSSDKAVALAIRTAAGPALGVLVRSRPGTFADAEDAMQDALSIAVERWPVGGIPDRPIGWLVRVAERRLIGRHRTDSARQRREDLVAAWSSVPADPSPARDDSLTLLLLCCHPALSPAAAVPLVLRAVGGLTTREIADALLATESTVAQRISRAKAAIAQAPDALGGEVTGIEQRLPAVMQVIYLVFTEGHTASRGTDLQRADLGQEAIRLARLLHELLPDHDEATGLLALILLNDARRAARTDSAGDLVPLHRQDRSRWDRAMITEGLRLLTSSMGRSPLGDYRLQACIAAVHDQAGDIAETDWPALVSLYDRLLAHRDNPMAVLSRAVAIAHVSGVDAALSSLEPVATRLADHHRYHATIAYLADLDGRPADARDAAARAAALAGNDAERRYLLDTYTDS